MLNVESYNFSGIAGTSTYWVVGPDRTGQFKTFNSLLQGGFFFPGTRAVVYAFFHR